jgi:hypothetical protein
MFGKYPWKQDARQETQTSFTEKFDGSISRHCRWIEPFPISFSHRKNHFGISNSPQPHANESTVAKKIVPTKRKQPHEFI